MKKVTFKKLDKDSILGIPRPNILPSDWYKGYEHPSEYFDSLDLPNFFIDNKVNTEHLGKWDIELGNEWWKSELMVQEENPTNKYFYLLGPAFTSNFFHRYKYNQEELLETDGNKDDYGFEKILDKDILNDVKNGICKVVIFCADDGHYGEKVDCWYEDDTLQIINDWVLKSELTKDSVIFISQNFLIKEVMKKYNYNFQVEPFRRLSETHLTNVNIVSDNTNLYQETPISNLFLTYNKHPKPYRVYLIKQLNDRGLLDKGLYSFHNDEPQLIEPVFKALNRLLRKKGRETYGLDIEKNILSLSRSIHYEHDYLNNYNGPDADGQLIQFDDYLSSFVSLVSESNVGIDTVYFSEKTYKPIVAKHPFILLSSQYSLKKLKELGYKTFDKWWDESYDECVDYIDRIDKIIEIITDLSKLNQSELKLLRKDMNEVLEHNALHFEKIKETDMFFYNILKKYL